MDTKIKHFAGEIIGTNKILYEIPERKNSRTYYYVECMCCGKKREVRSDNLHQKCRSCAAKERIKNSSNGIGHVWDDLTGKKFGNWLVLKKADKNNYWLCKDVKTNIIREVFRGNLTSGKSRGDGSICSWGETQIIYILNNNNINYKKEYIFSDLVGKNNTPLRFDFGIYSEHQELLFLIEYQGRQHYTYDENWNQTYDEWLRLIDYDKKKIEYCKNNNLILLILNEKSDLEQEILKLYNNMNKGVK